MIRRLLITLLACLPGGFHYFVTAPALWAHSSSAAFDAWVGLWIIAILLPFWTYLGVRR